MKSPSISTRVLLPALLLISLGRPLAAVEPSLFERLSAQAPGLDREVLRLALNADRCARARGEAEKNFLTVIDYSLPSTTPGLSITSWWPTV